MRDIVLFFWICCSLRSPTPLQQNFGYCGTSFFLLFFPFTLKECKGCVLPILPHPPDVPSCRPRQRRQRSSPRRSSRVRSAEAPRSRTAVRAVRGAVPGRAPLPAAARGRCCRPASLATEWRSRCGAPRRVAACTAPGTPSATCGCGERPARPAPAPGRAPSHDPSLLPRRVCIQRVTAAGPLPPQAAPAPSGGVELPALCARAAHGAAGRPPAEEERAEVGWQQKLFSQVGARCRPCRAVPSPRSRPSPG